jgi:Domain of unknown function (DUF4351)/Putative transposase, YhgA-like
MTETIEHDRLFKELLSTFFFEFLELFLPDIASTVDIESIQFLPQEYFADLTAGEEKIIDLLVEVQQAGEDVGFLVHIEAQSYTEADFARRMFFYFARLYQKYRQRVYPIVVFSFDEPYRVESNCHIVEFPNRKVLEFSFEAIQLNRLNWRDFLSQRNPVAAALMAKMQIMPEDRPKVKVECLRILATLRLDAARTRLISGFVDTYLRLNPSEETIFQAEIDKIEPSDRGEIMQIVTSWMQQGIEQGIEQGERSLILRILVHRVGAVPDGLVDQLNGLSREQLESLGVALLDFSELADLENWLTENV